MVIRRRTLLLSSAASAVPSWAVGQCVTDTVAVDACRGGVYVGGAPSLDLNFTGGTLDPRITFTRAAGPATYFDVAGVLQTAGTNVPRFDYDPVTHAPRGLLIEEARTNALLRSGDLSVAPWTSSSAFGPSAPVVTGNNAVAPDGTTTAARIVLPACSAGGLIQVFQNVSTVVDSVFSMYLRGAVGGEQTYLVAFGASAYANLRVTLTTSWQRFSLFVPARAGGINLLVGTDLRDATQAATPAGTIYAWGAQSEAGGFPTSYIPTTSAAATRAADVATMPVGTWFNAAAGTLAADYVVPFIRPGASQNVLDISDGTTNNRYVLRPNFGNHTPTFFIVSASVLTTSAGLGVVVDGARSKLAMSYMATAQAGSLDGGAVQSTASAAPAGLTTMTIGASASGSSGPLGNAVSRVRYWPRALSATELQQAAT